MKINSKYLSTISHGGYTRLIALHDFTVSFKIQKEQYSFEVKKDDIGGILSDDSEIIGNAWIGYEATLTGRCRVINSYILDNSEIKQSTIINSTVSDSRCWFSAINNSTVYFDVSAEVLLASAAFAYAADDFRNYSDRFTNLKLQLPFVGMVQVPSRHLKSDNLFVEYLNNILT